MTEAAGHGGGEGHSTSRIVKVGVIATIVASVAGLITTGVATFYSARVADDQLKQSRQAAEEKKQAQAARVSYWVDIEPGGMSRLHLMNRSPDPISNVAMTFVVPLERTVDNRWDIEQASFSVRLPSVPPCSDMVFTTDNMKYYGNTGPRDPWATPFDKLPPRATGWRDFRKSHPPIYVFVADFDDRDGVRWRRAKAS